MSKLRWANFPRFLNDSSFFAPAFSDSQAFRRSVTVACFPPSWSNLSPNARTTTDESNRRVRRGTQRNNEETKRVRTVTLSFVDPSSVPPLVLYVLRGSTFLHFSAIFPMIPHFSRSLIIALPSAPASRAARPSSVPILINLWIKPPSFRPFLHTSHRFHVFANPRTGRVTRQAPYPSVDGPLCAPCFSHESSMIPRFLDRDP
jgi:hypothetical protein